MRVIKDNMKRIAIVGAGGTGHALAALLSSRGHEVYLTDSESYLPILKQTAESPVIHFSGTVTGCGKITLSTTDTQAALSKADMVVCCTISNRDEEVAARIAPYVSEDKPVLLAAGNGGSILYHRVFERMGKPRVLVAETGGNFFPCRMISPGQVVIGLPLGPKPVAAFPPENTARAVEAFRDIWELTPAKCIPAAMFNGPNLISHLGVVLLNVGAIEKSNGSFNLFTDGITPSVINLTDDLWAEKKAVLDAFGVETTPPVRGMFEGVMDPDNSVYQYFRMMDGPDTLENRYITEDVPILTSFFVSIARGLGIPVPLFESMVRLISSAAQKDFYAQGRTLENLGLGHLDRDEIIAYFCGG